MIRALHVSHRWLIFDMYYGSFCLSLTLFLSSLLYSRLLPSIKVLFTKIAAPLLYILIGETISASSLIRNHQVWQPLLTILPYTSMMWRLYLTVPGPTCTSTTSHSACRIVNTLGMYCQYSEYTSWPLQTYYQVWDREKHTTSRVALVRHILPVSRQPGGWPHQVPGGVLHPQPLLWIPGPEYV